MGRAFEYRRAAKEKRWANMSRIFPKLSRLITIAAKESGPDPEMNPKLRTAISNAKAQNMPKDNIDSAIKRAAGKDSADYQEVNYEGKGPHGVLVFVETATDNPTRTVANVKLPFSKAGGQLVPSGSLEFLFDRKSVFEIAFTEGMDLEELELDLIDAGLEEIEADDEHVLIYGEYKAFGTLHTALEEKGIEIKEAKLERFSNDPKEYTDEQKVDIEKLLDKLEDDDDVQNVFTNMA
jgi:YebC/PmpR family DNA-binding regulatory protein